MLKQQMESQNSAMLSNILQIICKCTSQCEPQVLPSTRYLHGFRDKVLTTHPWNFAMFCSNDFSSDSDILNGINIPLKLGVLTVTGVGKGSMTVNLGVFPEVPADSH